MFLSFSDKSANFLTAFMSDFTVEFFSMGFSGFFSAFTSSLFNGHFSLLLFINNLIHLLKLSTKTRFAKETDLFFFMHFSFLDKSSNFLPTFMTYFLIEISTMSFSSSPPTFLTAYTSSFLNTHCSLSLFVSQQDSSPVKKLIQR